MCGHLPGLLAGGAEPGALLLAVGAAGLADVEAAVEAGPLGVEQEGEGGAAADAAVLVEAVLPGEDGASAAFLRQDRKSTRLNSSH